MVAISLYRGNLHRVEDVPRRWVMPRPNISMKDFRGLLNRRSKALSLLKSGHALASTSAPYTMSNGYLSLPPPSLPPLPPPPPLQKRLEDNIEKEDEKHRSQDFSAPLLLETDNGKVNAILKNGKGGDVSAEEIENLVSPVTVLEKLSNVARGEGGGGGSDTEDLRVEKDKGNKGEQEKKNDYHNSEDSHKLVIFNEKEKRKREVEETLEILTKKKHNLVQALKQILSAEEELKKKSSIQPTRPSVSLQVDVSNDSGSITRGATPRTGSEANAGGNAGGGETDDVLNHDLQSRHVPRMSSISPSAESALKRPYSFQHNVASNPSRSSPLRFAFPGNQGQPSNLPPVSTSGTNYAVSLSSPAASVGTSSCKDARSASS